MFTFICGVISCHLIQTLLNCFKHTYVLHMYSLSVNVVYRCKVFLQNMSYPVNTTRISWVYLSCDHVKFTTITKL